MTVLQFPPSRILNEPWVSKRQLAQHLCFSVRWVELRTREGMPSELRGNRRRYKISEVEAWLQRRSGTA